MKKKGISLIIVGLVVVIFYIYFGGKSSNDIARLNSSDVRKITVNRVTGYYTITDQEDIEKILDILKSMRLRRTFPHNKDGMIANLDIYEKNSNQDCNVLILGNDITINQKNYKFVQNYSDELIKLFTDFEKKYQINRN